MAKRKKSKITRPNDGMSKPKMKAFRATAELSSLLDGVENASEFIEMALLNEFSKQVVVTCPTCGGKGKIGREKRKLRKVS